MVRCIYFSSPKGCGKGDRCTYEHYELQLLKEDYCMTSGCKNARPIGPDGSIMPYCSVCYYPYKMNGIKVCFDCGNRLVTAGSKTVCPNCTVPCASKGCLERLYQGTLCLKHAAAAKKTKEAERLVVDYNNFPTLGTKAEPVDSAVPAAPSVTMVPAKLFAEAQPESDLEAEVKSKSKIELKSPCDSCGPTDVTEVIEDSGLVVSKPDLIQEVDSFPVSPTSPQSPKSSTSATINTSTTTSQSPESPKSQDEPMKPAETVGTNVVFSLPRIYGEIIPPTRIESVTESKFEPKLESVLHVVENSVLHIHIHAKDGTSRKISVTV